LEGGGRSRGIEEEGGGKKREGKKEEMGALHETKKYLNPGEWTLPEGGRGRPEPRLIAAG